MRHSFFLCCLLAASAPAQEQVWQRTGTVDVDRFGDRIGVLGDVNGDGYRDLAHIVLVPYSRSTRSGSRGARC